MTSKGRWARWQGVLTNGSSPTVSHGACISRNELASNEPGGAVRPVLRKETGQVVEGLEPVNVACRPEQT